MIETTQPIMQYLEGVAARQPTPGGGSVAALVGALSSALGEMVLNYSIGHKDLAAFADEFRPALATLTHIRNQLAQYSARDQQTFESLMAARKLPKETPRRDELIDNALIESCRVPESVAQITVGILEACDKLVSMVNVHLLSDLAICADLAMATIRCSVYNVRVNLPGIKNPDDRLKFETSMGATLKRAVVLIQNVAPRIWDRHAQEC